MGSLVSITIGIFVLDSFFPLGFVIPVLYLLPVILTIRVRRPTAPFIMAGWVTGLTVAGIWIPSVTSLQPGLFNRSLVILACWIAATIIWHTTQKYARWELEALVATRTAALKRSETTLQSFFNSTDLMMGVVEIVEGRPVMVITNRAALAAGDWGEHASELLPPALRLAPGGPEFWIPHLEAARRTERAVHVNYQIPSTPIAALSERIMTAALSFIGCSAGGNGLYAWIGEDITEKMHLDRRTEASRRSLEVSQVQLRQLTAQLLSAQDDERRRIARELHDELNQRVISLAFDIDDRMQQAPGLPAAARTTLQLVKNEVAELSDHLRDLAHRLHPSVLDDLGITSALRVCAQEFQQREHILIWHLQNPTSRWAVIWRSVCSGSRRKRCAMSPNMPAPCTCSWSSRIMRITSCCGSKMTEGALRGKTATISNGGLAWSAWVNACVWWKARSPSPAIRAEGRD